MNDRRKEKAERAEQIAKEAIGTLAAALDRGKSEGLKNHLEAMARFNRYSFGNVLLIWAQREDATNVAGFRAWQQKGRQVKKGEKGILIRAPYTLSKRSEEPGNEKETVCGFKAAYVFDVSQTEGDEIETIATVGGSPRWNVDKLRKFAGENGIKVKYDEHLPVEGRSEGGVITLKGSLSVAAEFSTLVHELAHELIHHRDDREKVSRLVAETEAEAVAYVVSSAAGLDAAQASADYIQLYRGSSKTLWDSLERVQKAASTIISGLEQTGA